MTFLEGLQLIDYFDLPHPAWQFVRKGSELSNINKISAYAGWTIRTAAVFRGKYKNLYVNWLTAKEVTTKIDKFQKELKGKGLFVVYPSWHWLKGGTMIKEPGRIIIEAIAGAVVDLARHGKVEADYFYSHGKLIIQHDDKNIISKKELNYLLRAARLLRSGSYYLEWAVSTKGKFIFYRLRDLASEAKDLVAKYA